MAEGLHVHTVEARKLLREILVSGTLTYSGHAKSEMAKDELTNLVLVSEREAVVVTAWRIRR